MSTQPTPPIGQPAPALVGTKFGIVMDANPTYALTVDGSNVTYSTISGNTFSSSQLWSINSAGIISSQATGTNNQLTAPSLTSTYNPSASNESSTVITPTISGSGNTWTLGIDTINTSVGGSWFQLVFSQVLGAANMNQIPDATQTNPPPAVIMWPYLSQGPLIKSGLTVNGANFRWKFIVASVDAPPTPVVPRPPPLPTCTSFTHLTLIILIVAIVVFVILIIIMIVVVHSKNKRISKLEKRGASELEEGESDSVDSSEHGLSK